jgi:hypothetical protein
MKQILLGEGNSQRMGRDSKQTIINVLKIIRTFAFLASFGMTVEGFVFGLPFIRALFPGIFSLTCHSLALNLQRPIESEHLKLYKFTKFRKYVQENTDFFMAQLLMILVTEDSIDQFPEQYQFFCA